MSSNGADDLPNAATRAATPHGFTALRTGTRLDNRYTIEAVLAAGGFGITYIARHDGLGRTFAIKEHFPRQFAYRDGTTSEVRPTDPGTYKWALDRFLLEGRALARCTHPNVVDVTDVFEANQTAYMVLVYEDGQSLKSWLDTLGRPPTQVELDVLVGPLLDALEFVHAQDLLHRDLAPDNIMVRRDGKPCLIDFGAARQALAQRSQVMSAIVKTGFSPPEQYTTTGRAQGPWSDIYALGATLYRAVTGRVPTESTDRQIDDQLVPVAEAVADRAAYRPGFLAGIDAALRLKQGDRPQNIAELRAKLMGESEPQLAFSEAARLSSGEQAAKDEKAAKIEDKARETVGPKSEVAVATFSSLPAARAVSRAGGYASPVLLLLVIGFVGLAGLIWYSFAGTPWSTPTSSLPVTIERPSESSSNKTTNSAAVKPAPLDRLVAEPRAADAATQRVRQDAAIANNAKAPDVSPSVQNRPTVPLPPVDALKSLEPLLEKDKQRFSRLFESRAKALDRSVKNAQGDAKALAAIEAAKKLLASPSITTVPDQLVGRWRCRSISLGGSLGDGSPQFAADIGGNFECRISRDAKGLVFSKLTGSMKKLARLDVLPVDGNFVLYYGTTIAQSDPQPVYPGGDAYGHEVGVLAQLSADRLRLELSEPNHSASAGHEVIELTRIK